MEQCLLRHRFSSCLLFLWHSKRNLNSHLLGRELSCDKHHVWSTSGAFALEGSGNSLILHKAHPSREETDKPLIKRRLAKMCQ